MGSSISFNGQSCTSNQICECETKEKTQMYDSNPLYHSFKANQLEEEVADKDVAWAIEMNENPGPERRNSKRRLSRKKSNISRMSVLSTGTAHAGEANARMNFDLRGSEYEYDESQLLRLIDVQEDGTVVLNGLMPPLASTSDGHTGLLPGDSIMEVAGSHDRGEDCLRDLKVALAMGGVFTLVVATRPEYFDIEVLCEGEYWHKLGCIVTIEKEYMDRIRIQSVADVGLIPAWNQEFPSMQVLPGDWIISVNGEEKTAQKMAKDISDTCEGDFLELGIQSRPRVVRGGFNSIGANTNPKSSRKRQPDVVRARPSQWEVLKSHFTGTDY